MKKITPNLWFDGNAREAAEYYVSVFPNSKITETAEQLEELIKMGMIEGFNSQLNKLEQLVSE